MKHKVTQLDKIRKHLIETGSISRNWCIDTRLSTRLSEYIRALRMDENFDIETSETKTDTIYKLKNSPFRKVEYKILGTDRVITKYERINILAGSTPVLF